MPHLFEIDDTTLYPEKMRAAIQKNLEIVGDNIEWLRCIYCETLLAVESMKYRQQHPEWSADVNFKGDEK